MDPFSHEGGGQKFIYFTYVIYVIYNIVNGRGDVCDDDYDGDLILDLYDDCPAHKNITTIDFRTLILIPLDPIGVSQRDPRWVVKNKVCLN